MAKRINYELKPCPFCGGRTPRHIEKLEKESGVVYRVFCYCGANTNYWCYKAKAVECWNARVEGELRKRSEIERR